MTLPFGAVFFAINLPFYYLAFRRMGWRFTAKTFCAVALVSVLAEVHVRFIHFSLVDPFYTAVFGGLLMGVGFIVLFRHGASLGGVNILALYLQDSVGIRAGKLQMAVDLAILLASFFVVKSDRPRGLRDRRRRAQPGDLDESPARPLRRVVGALSRHSE